MPPPRLSPRLKHLLATPGPQAPDAPGLAALFDAIRIQSHPTRRRRWLLILTGALFALNAVHAIPELYRYAMRISQEGGDRQLSEVEREEEALFVVGRMREVGLKTISFMGVPRAINCLAALNAAIKQQTPHLVPKLPKEPRRELTPANLPAVQRAGKQLWDDIYEPHHEKLLTRLADAHPDLPVHILQCHYAALLAAPVNVAEDVHSATPLTTATTTMTTPGMRRTTDLDRVECSVVAVTCLRALGGVEKQVESHVFGLRKAAAPASKTVAEETDEDDDEDDDEWITSDPGCVWLLSAVDQIVHVFRGVRE